jgi:hypothetical protein
LKELFIFSIVFLYELKSISSVIGLGFDGFTLFSSIKDFASLIDKAYHIVLSPHPQIPKVGIHINFSSRIKAHPEFHPAIRVSVFIYLYQLYSLTPLTIHFVSLIVSAQIRGYHIATVSS